MSVNSYTPVFSEGDTIRAKTRWGIPRFRRAILSDSPHLRDKLSINEKFLIVNRKC